MSRSPRQERGDKPAKFFGNEAWSAFFPFVVDRSADPPTTSIPNGFPMSNTVVTLTGDDANLFKAYQRIIAQQAKIDAGLKGVGDQAKKTKTGLDALASTDFDDLNDSMEDLGDTSSLTAGISTSTFFKMAAAINISQLAVDGLISSVQSSIDHFKELQRIGEQTLERTERTAIGQQEAAKNLVKLTPEEFRDVQERIVPQIQQDTSFTDRSVLSQAFGEVQSITSDLKVTTELVRESAKLNRLTPENLIPTATAIADIVRNVKVSPAEAVGMLASTQTVFRAPEQKAVARGIADVSSAAISTSTKTIPISEIAKEATALLSVLGKDDAEGRSSITGTLALMNQVRQPFTPEARDERDKRFEQLTRDRDLEIEKQQKLGLDIARADVNAKQFSQTDATPKAAIARNAAAKARRDLERSRADLQKTEEEMARISRLQAVQMNDPGTPISRLETIAANPDLRAEVVKNLTGELAYRDEMESLLTPNSELRTMLSENQKAISIDPKQADRLQELLDSTPQQKQARISAESSIQLQRFDDANPELAAVVKMRDIVRDTMNRRTTAMEKDFYLQNFLLAPDGTIGSMLSALDGNKPEMSARTSIKQLEYTKGKILEGDPNKEKYSSLIDAQIASINQELELYREQAKNSSVMPTAKPMLSGATDTSVLPTPPIVPIGSLPPAFTTTQAPANAQTVTQTPDTQTHALLAKQNELMEETNRLLKETARPTQPAPAPPPNPNAINAQQSLRNQE